MRVPDPASDAVAAAPSTLLAEEIHRLIGRSRRLLWIASARSLEARGDSPFTWQVLCYLVHHGPTVQQDLAMATAQDPAGMSRVLDELEGRKLVRRSPDANDRRRSIVEATKKGTAWYRSAATTVATAVNDPLQALTVKQQRDLCALLRVLLQMPPVVDEAAPKPSKRRARPV